MKTGDSVCMTALDLPPSPKPKKKLTRKRSALFIHSCHTQCGQVHVSYYCKFYVKNGSQFKKKKTKLINTTHPEKLGILCAKFWGKND